MMTFEVERYAYDRPDAAERKAGTIPNGQGRVELVGDSWIVFTDIPDRLYEIARDVATDILAASEAAALARGQECYTPESYVTVARDVTHALARIGALESVFRSLTGMSPSIHNVHMFKR